MKTNLSIREIILLANVMEDLTPSTKVGEYKYDEMISKLLGEKVTYNKETGMTEYKIAVRDDMGMLVHNIVYYDRGLLQAMDNYKAALSYAVLLEFTDNHLKEDEWEFSSLLTEMLGFDYRNLNGHYGKVYVKVDQDDHYIKVSTGTDTVYTVEQFFMKNLQD